MTIAQLRNVWILPISACVNIALGWTMGAVVVRLLRVPPAFRGPAVAASAFGNSLALPVVLIVAVVRSGEVGRLVFTEEDEAEAMLYLGAYMTTLTILMWTLGPMLYAHDDDDDQKRTPQNRRGRPFGGDTPDDIAGTGWGMERRRKRARTPREGYR